MLRRILIALSGLLLAAIDPTPAQALDYVSLEPLSRTVTAPVKDCRDGKLEVPLIAWGADIATIHANGNAPTTRPGSLFAAKGLSLTLYRQDDFARQVADYRQCRSPFLRGTMGMIGAAAESLSSDPRTVPVVIYQLSWSAGADALVVKDTIRQPRDLKGKTIALQAYGPHVDYLLKILGDSGLKFSDVRVKWVRDLIQVDEKSVSPIRAFREDASVDAAMVILPDALALTSGGAVGTGSEDSVRGARILLSTKTANRVIADVYAVRADYLKSHRDQVAGFVNALMLAEERMAALMKAKGDAYGPMISAAAEMLLDSKAATADAAAMYGDAEMAGHAGNVKFFTDASYPRGFDTVSREIGQAMIQLGLASRQVPLTHAGWDYARLAEGLASAGAVEVQRFDPGAVQQLVEKRSQQRSEEGVLFSFEIYFGPNQNTFPADQYRAAYERVVQLASAYGGALLTVEGHSDPLGYLREKKAGQPAMVLNRLRQAARNLSYTRANTVMSSIIDFAQSRGVTLDASQFGVTGWGVARPSTPRCTYDAGGDINLDCAPASEQEWAATRRVVFKIVQVEAETSVFKPL